MSKERRANWSVSEVEASESSEAKKLLSKLRELKLAGEELPLHYELYLLLTENGGKFPNQLVEIFNLSADRVSLIEKIVPDIAINIFKLELAGYDVETNPVHSQVNPETMAEGMKKVVRFAWPSGIDEVGNPTGSVYPLKEKVFGEILLDNISRGLQDTFSVSKDGEMIATFCNVRKNNAYGRNASVELGRTAADYRYLPKLKEQGLTLRGVSQLRLLQLLLNPEYSHINEKEIGFVYSDIRIMGKKRVTSEGALLVPDSRSVQGVFFGGLNRSNPVDLGFGIWGSGWQYVMGNKEDGSGGCEPFMRIGQFLNSEALQESLEKRTIWVPSEEIKHTVLAFLSSMVECDQLNIQVLPETQNGADYDPIVVVNPGLSTAYTSIDCVEVVKEGLENIKNCPNVPKLQKLSEALADIKESRGGIDHQVPYIEAYCECTTLTNSTDTEDVKKIQQSMRLFLEMGFTVTGITPSDKTDGIRITFSLITNNGLEKGLEPYNLPPEYYEKNRTSLAVQEINTIFPLLRERSIKSKFNA